MPDRIPCAQHGSGEATYVCVHVEQSLKDSVPRGFHWHIDESQNFQAFCDACNAMDEQTWAQVVASVSRAICIQCFQRAAALNGVQPKR
ncbi:MAG: hypothetical protein IT547_01680 [Hyphomonadaceae bacterium]|jgi:hypothetical protein|nr:hypothetical protein [Hyphomonadaceae bacterium]